MITHHELLDKYKNVLILYDSGIDYFIHKFEEKGIQTKRTFKKSPLISRIFKKSFDFLNLSQSFWYGNWKKDLPTLKTIIIFAGIDPTVVKFIRKSNKKIRVIYWYWNPVYRLGIPKNWLFKIAETWSFDPEDCIRYGFKFNTTFYFKDILLPQNCKEYDVIFLGNNKGRIVYLKQLQANFSKLGINGYYYIVSDKNEEENVQTKEIPYSEYLKMLSKTKAIIDVMPLGQSGLTLRSMESVFFKKKLITNDTSIKKQAFYKPENVFILRRDNEELLQTFLNSPYSKLDDAIVEKYDVINWLERFNIQ